MTSFKKYFIDNQRNILIPALQRDYVQGERDEIIRPFLEELASALKGEKIDLNYIYGAEEEYGASENKQAAFVPIDGQQRLITLWLLHLYLYAKQEQEFPVKLLFNSREFANEFAEKLSENITSVLTAGKDKNGIHDSCCQQGCPFLPVKNGIKAEIIDSCWFVSGWKHDKTVSNMLNALEKIASICTDPAEYKEFENITFSFLDMKTSGLTDDVYVKMNGRGRPLTYFENLKAWMDGKITSFGAECTLTEE